MFTTAVLLTSGAALAQDADTAPPTEPMPQETAPLPDAVDTDPYNEPAPMTEPMTQPAPTVITPVIIDGDDDDQVAVTTKEEEPAMDGLFGRRGRFGGGIAALKAGIGTGDFTQANVREATGIGPQWDVRGVLGAQSPVALEGAYVGSSRGIADVPGTSGDVNDTQLVSNGVEGDLRLAAPIPAGDFLDVRPFAFGGVGYQYMTLWGDGAVDGANDDGDSVLTIPAGVGLDLGIGPVNVDVRGTYRHAIGSDLFGDASAEFDDPNALHSWNIGGALGVEF